MRAVYFSTPYTPCNDGVKKKIPILFFRKVFSGNETKRNETKRNETKRNETKRNETKRNETKRNETKRNFICAVNSTGINIEHIL
jgi:hypothetical protein